MKRDQTCKMDGWKSGNCQKYQNWVQDSEGALTTCQKGGFKKKAMPAKENCDAMRSETKAERMLLKMNC